MLRQNEIIEVEIDGKTMCAMELCGKDDQIPLHLIEGEKQNGILYRDGKAEKWNYHSFSLVGDRRCFIFDRINLSPLSALFTTHRKNALDIIRNIGKALEASDDRFLDLETGYFPLRRIYIVDEKDVLLLPPDMGSLISVFLDDERRSDDVSVMYKAKTEKGYTLILQMAELMYYAATGFLPYEDDDIKRNNYKYYPVESALKNLGETLDEKTAGLINVILKAKTQQQRDVMGNFHAGKALYWFNENAENLTWNLENREHVEDRNVISSSLDYISWKEKTAKVARKVNFWRRRGPIITLCTIIGIIVIWILTSWLMNFFKPPLTRDMNQEEIVEFVYESQNELNSNEISTACKGAKLPQEGEVINLFVSQKMREAYEMMDPVVKAEEWVDNGKGPIYETQMIYGTFDHEMERVDEDTIVVDFKLITPSSYELGPEPKIDDDDPNAYAFSYSVTQSFDFEWNKRGWWNIVDSEYTDMEFDGYEVVETQPKPSAGIFRVPEDAETANN